MDQDQSIQDLLIRLDRLTDEFRELRDGIHKVIYIADDDPEMALTRARKVLEYMIRDLYLRRCGEPAGTRPLENLLQRLVKDGYLPKRIYAYANAIREWGNVGTHSYGEGVTIDDVRQSLAHLIVIMEWYFETERPDAVKTANVGAKDKSAVVDATFGDPVQQTGIRANKGRKHSETESGISSNRHESSVSPAGSWAKLHWSYLVIGGTLVGMFGGAISSVFLGSQLSSVDVPGALLFCGALPGAAASLLVSKPQGFVPKAMTGAAAGAATVELLFLLSLILNGALASEFNRHLPFWLGPGDESVMMAEAFMLAVPLGAFPGCLVGAAHCLLETLTRKATD